MIAGFTYQQILFLIILFAVCTLLITEKIRIDLTAILIILALAISAILKPDEALSGFGSEPAIMVASVFVLSRAIFATGLSDRLGSWIGKLAGSTYPRMILVMMPAVALLSAFTHHVTITAVMLPVTLRLARENKISPSRLLMPMSFAASLGTTITIIGAPAFLIASGVLQQAGQPGLGIFSIAPIGLLTSAAGTIFMLLLGRIILPDRKGRTETVDHFRLDNYFTELVVPADSALIGKPLGEVWNNQRDAPRVARWLRKGRSLTRPFDDKTLQDGDILLVRTTPEDLASLQDKPGLALRPLHQYGDDVPTDSQADLSDRLIQAVVAPNSDLVGRSIGQIDFKEQYGGLVLGLWRQEGLLSSELARVRLRAGDVLVLLGNEEVLRKVSNDRSFLMMMPFQGETFRPHKAGLAAAIMLGSIAVAAMNVLPIQIVLLAGAAAVVVTGCLSLRRAYRAIDTRIYIFIAGAIPLGLAIQNTGTSKLLGDWLGQHVGTWNPLLVLFMLYVVAAVTTQFMSDAATTALLGPVAAALAASLHAPPQAYVVVVAMAAVAAFVTPIGHHGNLLVYGPGAYRFRDFLKAGIPLTIVVAVIVVLTSAALWGVR